MLIISCCIWIIVGNVWCVMDLVLIGVVQSGVMWFFYLVDGFVDQQDVIGQMGWCGDGLFEVEYYVWIICWIIVFQCDLFGE